MPSLSTRLKIFPSLVELGEGQADGEEAAVEVLVLLQAMHDVPRLLGERGAVLLDPHKRALECILRYPISAYGPGVDALGQVVSQLRPMCSVLERTRS
jgi:hypothetical protein